MIYNLIKFNSKSIKKSLDFSFIVDGGRFDVFVKSVEGIKTLNRNYPKYSTVTIKVKTVKDVAVLYIQNSPFDAVCIDGDVEIWASGNLGNAVFMKNLNASFKHEKQIYFNEKTLQQPVFSESMNDNYVLLKGFEEEVFKSEKYEDIKHIWFMSKVRLFNYISGVFSNNSERINLQMPLFRFSKRFSPESVPITNLAMIDTLAFCHNRYIEEDGKLKNSRLNFLKGENVVFVNENPFYIEDEFSTLPITRDIFRNYKKNIVIPREIENLITELEKDFIKCTNLYVPMFTLLSDNFYVYDTTFNAYRKFFENTKVNKIIILASYSCLPLVAAAKSSNVKVLEYQYAAMTKNHTAYTINYHINDLFTPDYLLTWGTYWADKFDREYKNVECVGYDLKLNGLENKEKKEKIVFVSQTGISKKICEYALFIAKQKPNLQIEVKLHAHDVNIYKDIYSDILNSKYKNIKIITDPSISIGEVINDAKFVVGAFSTALYEAASIGCITFVLDGLNSELSEDLYTTVSHVKLIKSKKEILHFIKNKPKIVENNILETPKNDVIQKILSNIGGE